MYQTHLISLIKVGEAGQQQVALHHLTEQASLFDKSIDLSNLAAVNSLQQHCQTYSALPDLVASFLIPCEDLWSLVLMSLKSLDMT